MICSTCNNEIPDGSKFCNQCGTKIEERGKTCPNLECRRQNLPSEANFCPDCGAKLVYGLPQEMERSSISRPSVDKKWMPSIDLSAHPLNQTLSGNDNLFTNSDNKNIFDMLFPVYGITLGKTKKHDIVKLHYFPQIFESGPDWFTRVKGLTFWDHEGTGVLKSIYTTRFKALPSEWIKIGMNWENSYNIWIDFLRKYDFEVSVRKIPSVKYYNGRKTLSAEMEGVNKRDNLHIELSFEYGNDKREGCDTNSSNSLYCITMNKLN